MRGLRVGLHGLVLALINLAAIVGGFSIYALLRPVNQIAVQLPVAVLFSVVAFALWVLLASRSNLRGLSFQGWGELLGSCLLAFLWVPVVFVPLHYITQGYLTDFDNLLVIWAFQLLANALAAALAGRVVCLSSFEGAMEF